MQMALISDHQVCGLQLRGQAYMDLLGNGVHVTS
jgi:hypothetical protein